MSTYKRKTYSNTQSQKSGNGRNTFKDLGICFLVVIVGCIGGVMVSQTSLADKHEDFASIFPQDVKVVEVTPPPKIEVVNGVEYVVTQQSYEPITKLNRSGSERGLYNLDKLTCPEDTFVRIKTIGDRLGLPVEVWYPIAGYESEFKATNNTTTDREDSRGIFQVNTWTNYPKNADPLKLYNIEFNCEYQMPELVKTYKEGKEKGLTGTALTEYVSRYGQRPDWDNVKTRMYIKTTIKKYYFELQNAKLK
jgi:hypothetical protein